MKKLLLWKRKKSYFPTDNLAWKNVLGENLKRYFCQNGLLEYGKSTVDYIEIDGESYQVEYIGNEFIGINDELPDVKLSNSDVCKLTLNKSKFASKVRELLRIGGAVSDIPNCDAYCIGDLKGSRTFRVFLCFSESGSLYSSIRSISKGIPPIVISFEEISGELQKLLYELDGKFFKIDECICFRNDSIEALSPIAELVGKVKRSKTSGVYYAWSSTGFHQPQNPNLNMLKIRILSSTRLHIEFDGEGDDFDYSDISIFRNENNGKMNKCWTTLGLLAAKKEFKRDEGTRKIVSRMNTVFRDFFGFPKRLIPFEFRDTILFPNFYLKAVSQREERKETFEGGGISEKEIVEDWERQRYQH